MNDIIGDISQAFVVLCGIAISQFFSGGTVVDHDPAFRTPGHADEAEPNPGYVISYTLALIILVTLSLRFLIGSHMQMTNEYKHLGAPSFPRFVMDVSFLMFFGAFLVGVAQAKNARAFMGWLALLSLTGIVWSSIAFARSPLAAWWLAVNAGQFALAVVLAACCPPRNAALGAGRTRAIWSFGVAGLWFVIFFFLDLYEIAEKLAST